MQRAAGGTILSESGTDHAMGGWDDVGKCIGRQGEIVRAVGPPDDEKAVTSWIAARFVRGSHRSTRRARQHLGMSSRRSPSREGKRGSRNRTRRPIGNFVG
jgi:hypothetical protein